MPFVGFSVNFTALPKRVTLRVLAPSPCTHSMRDTSSSFLMPAFSTASFSSNQVISFTSSCHLIVVALCLTRADELQFGSNPQVFEKLQIERGIRPFVVFKVIGFGENLFEPWQALERDAHIKMMRYVIAIVVCEPACK